MENNQKEKNYLPLKAEQLTVGFAKIEPEKNIIELFLKADPRIIMDKLDEKFGTLGWQKKTICETIDGKDVFRCIISVKSEGEWISRDDHSGGAAWAETQESKVMEADALRRCAVQFGIGRELYGFKNIVCRIKDNSGNECFNLFSINGENGEDKWFCTDELFVEQIVYDENYNITALSIKNASKENMRVFIEDRRENSVQGTTIDGESNVISLEDAKKVVADVGTLKGKTLGELTAEQVVHVWEKTKSMEVKKAALIVGKNNKDAKAILTRMGIKI